MNGTPTNEMLAGVEALIQQHKKIHAIKAYRELTGASLKVAKDAVEWFEQQGRWPEGLNVQLSPSAGVGVQPSAVDPLGAVQLALSSGQKIQAIKLYRELYGVGLKDAKDAVEYFQAYGRWQERAVPDATSSVSTGFEAPSEVERLGEVERSIARGQKLEAIKLFREIFEVGLTDAKDAVEAYAAHGTWPQHAYPLLRDLRREAFPEHSAADGGGGGHGGSSVDKHAPASHIASGSYAANAFTSTVSSTSASAVTTAPSDASSGAALAVLRNKLGDAPVLGSVAAECGLYKGFLFITDQRVLFVADRFGNWEVTEDLVRSEIERVEVKEDPFGFEIVIQAGFHSAHVSELSRRTAESLAQFLKGETQQLQLETLHTGAAPTLALPGEFHATASAEPEFLPPGESFRPSAALPAEMQTTKHPPLGSPAPGPTMALPARTPPSPGASIIGGILLAVFAAIPATAYGSAWRLIPMDDFPRIADSALFWAALALGGVLMRGDLSLLMRAGFVAGILDWAIGNLGGMYIWGTVVPCVILGAAFARRDKEDKKGLVIGAFLTLPIVTCNALLQVISLEVFIAPTIPFAFWSVQFVVAALRNRRAPTPAQA